MKIDTYLNEMDLAILVLALIHIGDRSKDIPNLPDKITELARKLGVASLLADKASAMLKLAKSPRRVPPPVYGAAPVAPIAEGGPSQ